MNLPKRLLFLFTFVTCLGWLYAPLAHAAPLRVQVKSNTCGNASSCGVTFDSNVTAGNFIVVLISCYYGTATCTTTDPTVTGYTKATGILDSTPEATSNLSNQWIYYQENVAGGATTVTVSNLSGAYINVTAVEYSGIATSNSLDATSVFRYNYGNHGFIGTGTYTSGTTAATAQASELAIGVVHTYATTDIYTPDSGWSEIAFTNDANHNQVVHEQILSSTGAVTESGSFSPPQTIHSTSVATFKAAGGGGGGGTTNATSTKVIILKEKTILLKGKVILTGN